MWVFRPAWETEDWEPARTAHSGELVPVMAADRDICLNGDLKRSGERHVNIEQPSPAHSPLLIQGFWSPAQLSRESGSLHSLFFHSPQMSCLQGDGASHCYSCARGPRGCIPIYHTVWGMLSAGLSRGLCEAPALWAHNTPTAVTQSCLTLCNPMNHSMPGLPVHHQLRSSLKLRSIILLPGESQGRGSEPVGCRLWGCTESDTT